MLIWEKLILSLSVAITCLLFVCMAFDIDSFHVVFRQLVISAYTTGILLGKPFPMPMTSSLFYSFSVKRLRILDLRLWCLIHLDLSLMQGERWGSSCILLHIQFDENHSLNIPSALQCVTLTSVKNQVTTSSMNLEVSTSFCSINQ